MTRAEIEKLIDELYQRPPKEFIEARSRLASELAAAGERARGSLVRDLPKPSSSAWVVNQLWFKRQPAFQALLETGKRLRAAQQGVLAGRGAQALQKAMADERRALGVLLAEARDLLSKAGLAQTPVTLERAKTTLQAIARSPDPQFGGRLAHDLELPGVAALVGTPSDEDSSKRTAARTPKAERPPANAKARSAARAASTERQATDATRAAVGRTRQRAKTALREAASAMKLAEHRRRQAEKQELAAKRILDRLDAELDRLEAARRRLEKQRANAKRDADAAERETARVTEDLEATAVALEEAKERQVAAQRSPSGRKRD